MNTMKNAWISKNMKIAKHNSHMDIDEFKKLLEDLKLKYHSKVYCLHFWERFQDDKDK